MRNKVLNTNLKLSTSNVIHGRVDNQEGAVAEVKKSHPTIPEVDILADTFTISVKDAEKNEVYKNDEEPFEYPAVPSLAVALKLYGANSLTDDKIQFLNEALAGSEETGKAVAGLLKDINDLLKTTAKNNAYQRVFNAHKPLTEENITNAHASIVRNFMKTQNVSDETAINTLQGFGVIPKDFTLEDFKANKGKR